MTPRSCLQPPARCETLASIVSRFGGTLEPRAPAETIDYALPGGASEEVRAFWRPETRVETGPGVVARLPGGRVFGAGIVLAPDGGSIARDVSLDFGKPFAQHWLLTSEGLPPPLAIAGPTAIIATTLGKGYGHWLLDELPRLLMLPRGEIETLIAHAAQPFSRLALAHWGWTGALRQAERKAHVECEQLVVPSLAGTVVQPTHRELELIADFTRAFQAPSAAYGERLYLTRDRARRRAVTNEPALWAELQAAGFAKVRLEDLTWPEQINAFRNAKVVVAPHGAGLANLAFCRPGTRVVELFNRAYVHGCFWRLAALRALDYRPVVPEGAEPLSQATSANRLDITADLPQVRAALR